MPMPPACLTAALLATRSLTPRSQTTILPVTLAGSSVPGKHSVVLVGFAPASPTAVETTSGAGPAPAPTPRPVYLAPLPSVSVFVAPRSWVLAATVIVHGELCATLEAPTVSPLLPAEVETKTPASAAPRKASSSAVTMYWLEPEIE